MNFYQCHLLGSDGEFRLCEQVEGQTVSAAIALCRQILAARPHYAGFELWQLTRLIHGEAQMLRAG
jgi:hypothetical protein